MILGTISAVDNSNGLQLIIDGEDTATTKKYTYMASYVPAANDRVLVEEVGGSYVIMGKVISDYSNSGVARTAETATNATNAVNATNATNATNADTAASCSGNAATATKFQNEYYQNGSLVYRVDRSYNSQLGTYIVTDVSLSGSSRNYFYKN